MIDLDTLNKEENYQVPDGYFEEFPKHVLDTIHKEKARRRTLWLSSVAAVMALVICSVTVVRYIQRDNKVEKVVITQSAQETELEEQMIDYYSSELAQMDYLNY